jgi:signal transduction histidine kinase
MTQEALSDLGSAAAGIAHDLNNQLTLILNYLEVSNLDGARAAAGRCTALTSSLLSWCRGETLIIAPLNLRALLVDFADSVHLPEGVSLTLDLPESLDDVKADGVALTRVLTNLVSNACDAMKGKGKLRISAHKSTVEVTDSGPGIAAEDAKRVFEPFYSTKGSCGTGLGLAIVREIMRQHGGGVWVRSTPGRGATFCLRFR